MIIKFNCHSSFGVDGKRYLLKFICRQARILSSPFKSEACVASERVRHHKANPLVVIPSGPFPRSDPGGLLEKAELLSGVSLRKASLTAQGLPRPGDALIPAFLPRSPAFGFRRGRNAQSQ